MSTLIKEQYIRLLKLAIEVGVEEIPANRQTSSYFADELNACAERYAFHFSLVLNENSFADFILFLFGKSLGIEQTIKMLIVFNIKLQTNEIEKYTEYY